LLTVSTIKAYFDKAIRYVGVFSDISKLKEAENQLSFLAHHDPLTGLANRRLLELRVEHALKIARRNRQPLALLMIDLDHFKQVNDNLGHAVGNALLKEMALRFAKRLRHTDTIARLGGDEFAVLLEGPTDREAAGRVAEDLLGGLDIGGAMNGENAMMTGLSIGISLFPEHGDNFSDLLRHADAALYQAKREGRGTFRYFSHLLQNQPSRPE
jgi:diguanylate cyclase (GGDEF)-like protein